MTKKTADSKNFPRTGMEYNDRFRMTVKEFGREIIIELNRGKAVLSNDGKKVTIKYKDSVTRKATVNATKPKTTP